MSWGSSPHGNPEGTQEPSADAYGGMGPGLGGSANIGGGPTGSSAHGSPHHNPHGVGLPGEFNDPFGYSEHYGLTPQDHPLDQLEVMQDYDRARAEMRSRPDQFYDDLTRLNERRSMTGWDKAKDMLRGAIRTITAGPVGLARHSYQTLDRGFKDVAALQRQAAIGNTAAQEELAALAAASQASRDQRSDDIKEGRVGDPDGGMGLALAPPAPPANISVSGLSKEFQPLLDKARDSIRDVDSKSREGLSLAKKAKDRIATQQEKAELMGSIREYAKAVAQKYRSA